MFGRCLRFLLLSCLLLPVAVRAQQSDRFTAYTVNDGLPQSSIDEIAQDSTGFLWIGTAGGLCRFDGYVFKGYQHNPKDAHSILSDRGFHFHLDKNKRLWVISYNGISIYDGKHDSFTTLLSFEPKSVITCEHAFLGEDNFFIYAGLCNYGVVRINKQTHRVTKLNIPGANDLTDSHSWYHGFLDDGKLWIVANHNTVIYDTYTRQTQKLPYALINIVNVNNGQVAAIADDGVIVINKADLSSIHCPVAPGKPSPNLAAAIRLTDSVVLLGSGGTGIYYFDLASKKVLKHISSTDQDFHHPLSAGCLYNDWSGNIWIGTTGEGVYKLEAPFKTFRLYRSINATNNINSVYADGSRLYAGNAGNGLDVFSLWNGFEQTININKKIPAVANAISVITPLPNGNLFLTGLSAKANDYAHPYLYDSHSGKSELFPAQVQRMYAQCWGQGNLRQFALSNTDGSVLTNVGEFLLSLQPGKNKQYAASIVHRFAGEKLSCCFKDRANNLWIGTYKGAYVLINNNWQPVDLPKQTEIKTICQDNAGQLWLGTNNGILVLNNKLKVVRFFSLADGLLNDHIYGILKDDDGNMWFSHNKGLSVYYPDIKSFRHFGIQEGLQSAEFNSNAYFKAKDGELFFGGINGITGFYPREILINPNHPKPNITNIFLFDSPYQSTVAHSELHYLELPHTDNSLSFEFAMPEYTNPDKNEYAYTMEGVDKKWIYSDNKRFARYAGLQPGHYVFEVRAANNDGIWGAANKIEIWIVPPFWQRAWFICLMVILFGGAIAFVSMLFQKETYRKRIRALELQNQIQLERERISRDLHDNIGTQLSLINKSIKEVIHPSNTFSDEERVRKLSSAQQDSSEVIDVLRETIWALNKSEITLDEFADNLKTFVQKKVSQYSAMPVEFTEGNENDQVKLSSSEALHLFRICQEAITNTIKYASAATLKIVIQATEGKYAVTIADDGIGFLADRVDNKKHYGLRNMKFRAREISCDLDIKTLPGLGTTITIIRR